MRLLNSGVLSFLFYVLVAYARAQDGESLWCVIEDVRDPGMPLPSLPKYYSTNIQLNFQTRHLSSEVTRTVDSNLNKSAIEIWAGNRHVKYISLQKDNAFLTIDYNEKGVTCSAQRILGKKVQDLYGKEDRVIVGALLGLERLISTNGARFISTGASNINGIYVQEWETCALVSEINDAVDARIAFADISWKPSHPPVPESNLFGEFVEIEMKIPGKLSNIEEFSEIVRAEFSRFLPFTPADEEFQPPEDVNCADFRTDIKPPPLPSYFRYNAEVITHKDATDVAPVVSHRTVYYDYKAGLTRIDLQNPSEDIAVTTLPLTARVATVIRNFNTGIEYTIDPSSGSCDITASKDSFDVLSTAALSNAVMLDPKKFFYMDGAKISYLGQYSTRGMKTDVYSSAVKLDGTSTIFRWYFTADNVQLVEDQEVQKNVLVKLVVKPESGEGKKGMVEINFYNFVQEEPSAFIFDVTSCYNETLSKTFVLSFSGQMNAFMQEYTTVLKQKIHQTIMKTAGVSQTRVAVQEVILKTSYLYAQFMIVDVLPLGTKPAEKESTLDEAVKKLQTAVSDGTLEISLIMKDNIVVALKPDPLGLKEYSKEENVEVVHQGFSQGSVGGLAFGMILLGFLMGGVVVNLIISRKHGVSLFQKAGFGNSETSFNNPLNESPM